MPVPCMFEVVYTLQGEPSHLTVRWRDPEGRGRTETTPLSPATTPEALHQLMVQIAEGLQNDPF